MNGDGLMKSPSAVFRGNFAVARVWL
ncbi:MAG: hypothetical protein H6Q43_2402, partial [Deltaproteobacteria bacterium]|nr:hypothetical protein [Deltaproteobacteria bacterium]